MTCSNDSFSRMVITGEHKRVSTARNGVTLTLLGVATAQGTFSIAGVTNGSTSFSGPATSSGHRPADGGDRQRPDQPRNGRIAHADD